MLCAPKENAPCSECPALSSCPLSHFRMSEKLLLQKCVRGAATSEAESIAHACSLSCLCWPLGSPLEVSCRLAGVGCMEVMGLSVGLGASSDFAAVRHFHIPEPVQRTCRSGLWSRCRVSRKNEGTESSLLGEEWKCARVPCRGGLHCCVPFVAEGSCLSDSCLPQQGFPRTD